MAKKSKTKGKTKPFKNGLVRVTKIPILPKRPIDSHKGTFGRVLVIAGSREMLGAACLTTESALRSGAGLVTLACPESIQLHAASNCICATTIPLPETKNGMIDSDKAIRLFEDRGFFNDEKSPSVIAAGPGIGQFDMNFAKSWVNLIREFDRAGHAPIVLDADGLNAVSLACPPANGNISWPFSSNFVITPHPGEMGRLCGISTAEVQAQRENVAVSAARKMNELANIPFHKVTNGGHETPAVVVLKGAGTIVTDGKRLYKNTTGNPGMATGGTGDVLTGVIAGLIACGMNRFDAAMIGSYVHGHAADEWTYQINEIALTAKELCDQLTYSFARLQFNADKSKKKRRK